MVPQKHPIPEDGWCQQRHVANESFFTRNNIALKFPWIDNCLNMITNLDIFGDIILNISRVSILK